MARFLWWIIGIPVGVVLVALAVANRRPVTVAFNPFEADPVLTASLPLYALVFGTLMAGVVLGGLAVWTNQRRYRRASRRWREEADRLRYEREREEQKARDVRRAQLAALPSPDSRRAA